MFDKGELELLLNSYSYEICDILCQDIVNNYDSICLVAYRGLANSARVEIRQLADDFLKRKKVEAVDKLRCICCDVFCCHEVFEEYSSKITKLYEDFMVKSSFL